MCAIIGVTGRRVVVPYMVLPTERCLRRARGSATSALLLASLLGPALATAQPSTLYLIQGGTPNYLLECDLDNARVLRQIPLPGEGSTVPRLTLTADGRYVVWIGGEAPGPVTTLSAFDRLTSWHGTVARRPPLPPGFDALPRIESHPSELRVFANGPGLPVVDVTPGGLRLLDAGGGRQDLQGVSADGRRLLVSRALTREAVTLDTSTGALIGVVSSSPQMVLWALSPDGRVVYGHGYGVDAGGSYHLFRSFDAATGVMLRQVERPYPGSSMVLDLRVHPTTGALFADMLGGNYLVLDAVSLAPLGVMRTALASTIGTRLVFEPRRARAYVLARSSTGESALEIFDTSTLARVGGHSLGRTEFIDLAVVPARPAPPSALTASVEGSRVTLRWQPGVPALGTGFLVEAGSSPGLADLAVVATSPQELVVDNVPPGTYYVRVRMTMWDGRTDASEEIVVTVV